MAGIPPLTAIQMATLNPARYFMLNSHGAVAPGYYADLVTFDSLERPEIKRVFKNGKPVAQAPRWVLKTALAAAADQGIHFALKPNPKSTIRFAAFDNWRIFLYDDIEIR